MNKHAYRMVVGSVGIVAIAAFTRAMSWAITSYPEMVDLLVQSGRFLLGVAMFISLAYAIGVGVIEMWGDITS